MLMVLHLLNILGRQKKNPFPFYFAYVTKEF